MTRYPYAVRGTGYNAKTESHETVEFVTMAEDEADARGRWCRHVAQWLSVGRFPFAVPFKSLSNEQQGRLGFVSVPDR